MLEKLNVEFQTWVFKPLIWAMVAISIKLAVQSRRNKVTWAIAISSFITGIGSAYLFHEYVTKSFSHEVQPLVIAVIAISGEKIGEYILYKINFEGLLDVLIKIFKK
jgi:hypothetical protein